MKELQRKQKIRRNLYSTPSLIILFVITIFIFKGAVKIVNKERESSSRLGNLEEQVASMKLREEELKGGIAHLETEEGIKDEIRERFSVISAGEEVAVIVDEKRVATSTDTSGWPWYKRFWNAIIGNK